MVEALLTLLACHLIGETLARVAGLPVPGPVIGMALLLAGLAVRGQGGGQGGGRVPAGLDSTARGLLANLSLLFVPAGVGVMVHAGRIQADALPLAAALAGSTVLAIAAGGLAFRAVARRLPPPAADGEDGR